METRDDDLRDFVANGLDLPAGAAEGRVGHEGAHIWYASFGAGPAVMLLHGGLGHSGNWGRQVPALLSAGYRVIVADSRGHGRSTRTARPFTYELMAFDALAVLNALQLETVMLAGWSDGACTALVLAAKAPERVKGVFFFGCNMDPSGTREFIMTSVVGRCLERHRQDYARLSPTPNDFDGFAAAVQVMMTTQPNYSEEELAQIGVPVLVAQAEHDEFIRTAHAEYLAQTIPGAELVVLDGVSHFAPLQRPAEFNAVLLRWLGQVRGRETRGL